MSFRPMCPALLASFLEYAARNMVTTAEWNRFIVNHFQDPMLEHARSECARLFIEHNRLELLPTDKQNYLELLAKRLREQNPNQPNPDLIIDWAEIRSTKEFWDVVCREGQEPEWHGRNLAALNDSWVTGGISFAGPPYEFYFLNCAKIDESLTELAQVVMEIAHDSVRENGGSLSAT